MGGGPLAQPRQIGFGQVAVEAVEAHGPGRGEAVGGGQGRCGRQLVQPRHPVVAVAFVVRAAARALLGEHVVAEGGALLAGGGAPGVRAAYEGVELGQECAQAGGVDDQELHRQV